jgi:hypothetical protein
LFYLFLLKAKDKTKIFVSVYSPDINRNPLTEKAMWNITLQRKDSSVTKEPETIFSIKKKEPYTAFFPFINNWSREYLVVFDENGESPELMQQNMTLWIQNKVASVSLFW